MLVIFFPGAIGANNAHLEAAGLADLASDRSPMWIDFRGPENTTGMLCYWGDRPPAEDAAAYEWSPARGLTQFSAEVSETSGAENGSDPFRAMKGYRFGRLKGQPLTPESLARKQKQLGKELLLADGQAWTVPIARQLPRVLGLDDQGQWTGVIDRKYARFWDDAWKMLAELTPSVEGEARMSWTDAIDFAASALAINYRVNREIVAWLGLLRTDLIWPLIQIVVEFEEIAEAFSQKKTDAPVSDSPASSSSATA